MLLQSGLWIDLLLLVGLSASVVTVTVTKIYRTLAQCALKIKNDGELGSDSTRTVAERRHPESEFGLQIRMTSRI